MAGKIFSSSSSLSNLWIYDVFLSFRGKDTRRTFTDHLYHALKNAGIKAFRDDDEIRRGEDITSELVQAIQGSRISIIVFSRNYAGSRWCLEELANIMECRKSAGQRVLPIFYDVDPSSVRHQKGCFERAFAKHEGRFVLQMDKVARWRAALTEAADLSGWDLRNVADGYEGKFIKKIVQEILKTLNHTPLHEAIYPVRIDSRVKELILLLNIESNDVHMVGICGMGGIGKTTIAKATYNRLFHGFEGTVFLANVREISQQTNGKVQLQEKLLSDILKESKITISSVDRGINVIKKRLSQKKVLLILDDVDKLDQLKTLAGSRDWFGSGSKIIITTRDENLLKSHKVGKIYMVKEMNGTESLELFSLHAFGKIHPTDDYVELSKDVVAYSGGLPLALEVLGSFLSSRSIPEWKSALEKLRNIPHNEIQEILRISFDSLSDDMEKNIFLDISCFFVGMDKDYVVQILNGCGFYAEIGLSVLVQRCLVKINEFNKLITHDLLRDMGREIIREESRNEPRERSRLWCCKDVINMLTHETGTRAIEGLALNLPEGNDMSINIKEFSKLRKLRLLQLHRVQLNEGYDNFSKDLRWLSWHGFPLHFIPNDFYLGNVVAIDMQYSKLRQVWKDCKVLEKLKYLNLSHSHYLTRTPEFSKLPDLEKLELEDCRSLVDVDHSIGGLERLVLVNLKGCESLKNLPREFWKLKSLHTLILSGCPIFPKHLGNLESLANVHADNTASSPNYAVILLQPSLQAFTCLKVLDLVYCNLSDDGFPEDLGSLSSLVDLNLEGNSFLSLPSGISCLLKLQVLSLNNCTRLQTIADLPTNLSSLVASNCTSLERLPDLLEYNNLQLVLLTNCHKLNEAQKMDVLTRLAVITFMKKEYTYDSIEKGDIQVWAEGFGGIFVPGNEIPDLFAHKKEGSSIIFDVPKIEGYVMLSLAMCCVVSFDLEDLVYPTIRLYNYSKHYGMMIHVIILEKFPVGDHLWTGNLRNVDVNMSTGDLVWIDIYFGKRATVKEIGINLLFRRKHNDTNMSVDEEVVTKDEVGINAKKGFDKDGAESSYDGKQRAKRLRSDIGI